MNWADKLDLSHLVKYFTNKIVENITLITCFYYLEQLSEIRKSSVSRLFCDNSDDLHTIQPHGFLKISEK